MLLRGAPKRNPIPSPPIVSDNATQRKRKALLQACIGQLQRQSMYATGQAVRILSEADALSIVRLLCNRLHAVAVQLQGQKRQALQINDSYDVQDLLNALLRLHFDDVRAEKPTPSFGGNGSRTDFLLKNQQIVVEAKMTRTMVADKEVCFELMEDAAHYRHHSNCKKLVCLVYDPPGLIRDPRGVESYGRKLSSESLDVEVIVVPKDWRSEEHTSE